MPEEREKKPVPKIGGFRITLRQVNMALAVFIIFFVVFFPNIAPSVATASSVRFAPSDGWSSSLSWLEANSPEPFGDSDFYYQDYESPSVRRRQPNPGIEASNSELIEWIKMQNNYQYPESAYGVMSWWDYGYWITRIARRLPNSNPGQSPAYVALTARFFLSENEASVQEIAQALGSSYIIIDYQMTMSKFWAIATYAGKGRADYYDVYYIPQGDQLVPVQLFYPEFYRSLLIRLYNFDGMEVTPENTTVISYEAAISQENIPFKMITSVEQFTSHEEAEAYLSSQESANYKIVSPDPFASPVPLEALEHYRLVHNSDSSLVMPEVGAVPEVKIFEHVD